MVIIYSNFGILSIQSWNKVAQFLEVLFVQIDKGLFSERLRALMSEVAVSNYQLAKDLHISPTTVANWLKQVAAPGSNTIDLLAEYFGVLPSYLAGQTDTKRSKAEEYIRQQARVKPATEEDDEELMEYLEYLRTRPEARILMSTMRGATKEEVEENVRFIEALRKSSRES